MFISSSRKCLSAYQQSSQTLDKDLHKSCHVVLAHPISCRLFYPYLLFLFSESNIKRVWFSIAFCTFTETKAAMYHCNNREPFQCLFNFSILFIFHSYFNFFIRPQCCFNCSIFINWGIKMESLLII